ncbi:MAG TPA: HD domain-containing protein [Armatimonadetes bacterium]|nr:HD domain-containing protein [Armatimonadota bacterium]
MFDPSHLLEGEIPRLIEGWLAEARAESGLPDQQLRAIGLGLLQRVKELLSPERIGERMAYQETREVFVGIQALLCDAIDARVPETKGHSRKVAKYAVGIASHLGLPEWDIKTIEEAALIHDIGKVSITASIFMKRGRLSSYEFSIVKRHPVIGANILRPINFMQAHIPLILHHHEKWDGSGYPFGLKGEDIPLGARIIAAADMFDALTSDRPHRPAYSFHESKMIMLEEAGRSLDPRVVSAFSSYFEELLSEALEGP